MANTPQQFPKGDTRRLLALALAIAESGPMPASDIVKKTGHNKGTIDADIIKLSEQLDITIIKSDTRPALYKMESWGLLLKRENVENFVRKCLQS